MMTHHWWTDDDATHLFCRYCGVRRQFGNENGGTFSFDDGTTWQRFARTPECSRDPQHRCSPPAPRPVLKPAQERALLAIAGGDLTGGNIPWRGLTQPVRPATLDTLTKEGLIEPIREDGMHPISVFRFKHHRLTEAGRRLAESLATARDVAE